MGDEHRPGWLLEPEAKALLTQYGIRVPRGRVVRRPEEWEAGVLSTPLVAKLVSPDVLHKTDVGAVRLGLQTDAVVRSAVADLATLAERNGWAFAGVLVEEQVPRGVEMVVGGFRDARFGPVVMCGLGGIYVELYGDVSYAVAPITPEDARAMVEALRSRVLLRGYRGQPPVAENAVIAALLALGGVDGVLFDESLDIEEIDINPLIVDTAGAVGVDARIRLGSKEGQAIATGGR